jgi:hypothetical protein
MMTKARSKYSVQKSTHIVKYLKNHDGHDSLVSNQYISQIAPLEGLNVIIKCKFMFCCNVIIKNVNLYLEILFS